MQNYIIPRLEGCKFVDIIVVIGRIKHFSRVVTVQQKYGKLYRKLDEFVYPESCSC